MLFFSGGEQTGEESSNNYQNVVGKRSEEDIDLMKRFFGFINPDPMSAINNLGIELEMKIKLIMVIL